MKTQMTLDGKPIKDENFLIHRLAERYTERFARYCEGEGIVYRGKSCEANTFFCLADLERHFGPFITIEMIEALEKHAASKIPVETKFRIVSHDNYQTELLNPKGEEYKRPEETNLEEDTKIK